MNYFFHFTTYSPFFCKGNMGRGCKLLWKHLTKLQSRFVNCAQFSQTLFLRVLYLTRWIKKKYNNSGDQTNACYYRAVRHYTGDWVSGFMKIGKFPRISSDGSESMPLRASNWTKWHLRGTLDFLNCCGIICTVRRRVARAVVMFANNRPSDELPPLFRVNCR